VRAHGCPAGPTGAVPRLHHAVPHDARVPASQPPRAAGPAPRRARRGAGVHGQTRARAAPAAAPLSAPRAAGGRAPAETAPRDSHGGRGRAVPRGGGRGAPGSLALAPAGRAREGAELGGNPRRQARVGNPQVDAAPVLEPFALARVPTPPQPPGVEPAPQRSARPAAAAAAAPAHVQLHLSSRARARARAGSAAPEAGRAGRAGQGRAEEDSDAAGVRARPLHQLQRDRVHELERRGARHAAGRGARRADAAEYSAARGEQEHHAAV